MVVECQYSGGKLSLGRHLLLGAGGEGNIYELPDNANLVAKIYHPEKMTDERAGKLKAMLAHAPHDPVREQGHTSIAWPVELLRSLGGRQEVIGFLMPRLHHAYPIHILYDVKERHAQLPLFSYDSLCRAARNLGSAVRAIHQSGYVIGDVNESNIMVTRDAMVTLVDTDSFQVRDGGRVYRCPVGTEMFTPPELHGINFPEIDRAQEHDLFGLAVLFFRLLMEGAHPFAGVYHGPGEPPEYTECLIKGYFPYGGHQLIDPPPPAPPFDALHPQLRKLFRQCFVEGHADPHRRPDAKTWFHVLRDSESALKTCPANKQHQFFNHCRKCPWCERAERFGIPNWDPFPSPERARAFASFSYSAAQAPASKKGPTSYASTPRQPSAPPPPPPPPPASFSTSASNVVIGQAVTLQWAVPNAQTVRITDQTGRCVFNGASPNGFVKLYPNKTKTYRLAASGINIRLPSPITVTVTQTPLPHPLSTTYLQLNQTISLKAMQLGMRAGLSLRRVAVKLRSPLKLKHFSPLFVYGKLRRVPSGFKNYNLAP